MSRYCGKNNNVEPILGAAQHWKNVALLSDGSVFDGDPVWTLPNLAALDEYFINQPNDASGANFYEKLEAQLEPTVPAVKQLAAEMLWFMLLCPSNIGGSKKRETIQRIWDWSGAPFPGNSQWMADDILSGIGNSGAAYNTQRWRELGFFINAMMHFKKLIEQEQASPLSDGWEFAQWIERVKGSNRRQLRHMMLFLLFPDEFERIFGGTDRKRIAIALSEKSVAQVTKLSPSELDRVLFDIRKQKEEEYGTTELDFYLPPLKELWKKKPSRSGTKTKQPTEPEQVKEEVVTPATPADTGKIKISEATNLILHGPPGTGKTYELNKRVVEYSSRGQKRFEFVTFHQAYSYEDFVEGIRPVQDKESRDIRYEVVPGVFKRICKKAKADPGQRYAIFIDEINRGNIARIFGELITLLETDKRAIYTNGGVLQEGMELTLPYSAVQFGVPKNLDVYGTMNTADRSIALLDTALRRRFQFEELMPDSGVIEGSRGDGHIEDGEGGVINLRALLKAMNHRIRFLLNRDMTLGHAYFITVRDFDGLKEVLCTQVIPLLQEYFYEDWHRIQLVFRDVGPAGEKLASQIVCHETLNATRILGFGHEDFDDQTEYRVIDRDEITPDAVRKVYEESP